MNIIVSYVIMITCIGFSEFAALDALLVTFYSLETHRRLNFDAQVVDWKMTHWKEMRTIEVISCIYYLPPTFHDVSV